MCKETEVFREEEVSPEEELPWCRVEFSLTEGEIRKELGGRKLYPKLTRNIIESILLLLVGSGYVMAWFEKGNNLELLEHLFPILCIALLFARWGMPWIFLWKNAKEGAGKQLRLSFYEKKIRVSTETDRWWVSMQPAPQGSETKECFLLSLPSQQTLLIPKRCFSSEELSSVREFLLPAAND